MGAALAAIGTSDALQKSRHGIGGTEENDGIHIPDVDSQLKGAGGNNEGPVAAAEPVFDAPSFPGLEVGIMQLHHPAEASLRGEQGVQTVALPTAVGEQDHFPVVVDVMEIVQESDDLLVLSFDVDEMGNNFPLDRTQEMYRIGLKPEEIHDALYVGNGG